MMRSELMSTPGKLRVGYVPEHFSSPLLQLAAKDPSIELVSCGSGTGQLITAIRNNEIDIAIALTEALITGIAKKSADYKIIGTYVTSPLNWAVAVGKESKYEKLEDLKGEKIGISRIGSGSQVMASYMALREGWVDSEGKVEKIEFEVLDTFKNLRDGVNDGRAAAFMWEHFTTKPYLNELRFIDHVLTPWSSWLIVTSPEHYASSTVKAFLANLSASIHAFDAPAARESSSKEFIKGHFGYPEEDVVAWLEGVTYPKVGVEVVKKSTIEETLKTLEAAGVLEKPAAGWKIDDFVESILDTLTNTTCPEVNTATADDSAFLSDWNAHRIGWVVAGVCAGLTTIIASYNIWRHAKNYRKPLEQRQVIRILMMPIVFAVISFFGYRYYREFISFALIRDTYEAITTAAFLCLMLSILSDCPIEQRELLAEKEKRKLVAPFCCWQFRPSKPYFIWMVKWSVLQFVIVKPLGAVAGVITEAFGVYCETSNSLAFANIYVVLADSISVVVALYGLVLLYVLLKAELKH
ncbi:NMT1/THI5-like domain containing protein [Pseudohyphozyma bogoriensis]|nr:NMT1/THI5-like domain containing protein [Pseudohyphozyma bogoriensis]